MKIANWHFPVSAVATAYIVYLRGSLEFIYQNQSVDVFYPVRESNNNTISAKKCSLHDSSILVENSFNSLLAENRLLSYIAFTIKILSLKFSMFNFKK